MGESRSAQYGFNYTVHFMSINYDFVAIHTISHCIGFEFGNDFDMLRMTLLKLDNLCLFT